jgi:hypothetical protein
VGWSQIEDPDIAFVLVSLTGFQEQASGKLLLGGEVLG